MKFSSHQINDWLADRAWPVFWRSVPALLAVVGLLGTLVFVAAGRQQHYGLHLRYRRIVTGALGAGNFEMARVACLRGLSLDGDKAARLEWLFYLSVALNGLGHDREAAALLATAAPLDHPGCVPAHLATAQALLNGTNVTDAMVRMAGQHLLNALTLNPQSPEINEMLGRFYINTHDLAKARPLLKQAYPFKNNVALLLAITYRADRDESAARTWADAAIETFTKRLKNVSPRDSQPDRLGLVQALLIENNPAAALKILEEGMAISGSPAYDSAVAEVCATWAAQLAAAAKSNSAECLRLIQKGLACAPLNLKLWLGLIQISHFPDAAGMQAQALISEQVGQARGEPAAWWHFLLATDARQAGRAEESRRHLQAAYQFAPDIPQIANDRAMDLAVGPQADLPQALAIIQPVVEKFPTNPGFRDTRGRILLRLGRAAEAVADLEFAAARLQNAIETRQALAAARAASGRPKP